MNIFITGATGFIGRHLTKALVEQDHQVTALIRLASQDLKSGVLPTVRTAIYDGSFESVQTAIMECRPDIVIHLASLFLAKHNAGDIGALIKSNILLPTQLLEAMDLAGCKLFLNTGTSWQHFESESFNPLNLYAASKQAFEAMLRFYESACGFKSITLKLFDTYGPMDQRPKLFSLLRSAARSGQALNMTPGYQLIDLVYISDVVDAFLASIEQLHNGTESAAFAVSSGQPVILRSLVKTYERAVGKKVDVSWGALPYRPREVMTPWKGHTVPGWQPRITLEQGIALMESDASIAGLLSDKCSAS